MKIDMKLKALLPTDTKSKRIMVSDTDAKQLAMIHCDRAIQFNGSHEFYPEDIDKIGTIANNFQLFYQNIISKEDDNQQ